MIIDMDDEYIDKVKIIPSESLDINEEMALS
jgi:hypothetical protein